MGGAFDPPMQVTKNTFMYMAYIHCIRSCMYNVHCIYIVHILIPEYGSVERAIMWTSSADHHKIMVLFSPTPSTPPPTLYPQHLPPSLPTPSPPHTLLLSSPPHPLFLPSTHTLSPSPPLLYKKTQSVHKRRPV